MVQDIFGPILGFLWAIAPVNNVWLSWNFDHKLFSYLYKYHLKHFEELKFLQWQDYPNFEFLVQFWPQFVPWIRLSKLVKIKALSPFNFQWKL